MAEIVLGMVILIYFAFADASLIVAISTLTLISTYFSNMIESDGCFDLCYARLWVSDSKEISACYDLVLKSFSFYTQIHCYSHSSFGSNFDLHFYCDPVRWNQNCILVRDLQYVRSLDHFVVASSSRKTSWTIRNSSRLQFDLLRPYRLQ